MSTDTLPEVQYRSPFAGLGVRLLATALDSALIALVTLGIDAIDDAGVASARSALTALGACLVYYPVLWGTTGWTLGQRVLGLRVVRAADGTKIGSGTALVRALGCLVAAVPLLVGVLWSGWDSRKQGWQDKLAGTVVIHDR